MTLKKPFTTYRKQLKILRERNLQITDGAKAIKILKKEGYYNIINGYKEIFLDNQKTASFQNDFYKAGVTFEQVFSLYSFDRNMRSALIKSILQAETVLKTKIAYHFEEKFKSNFSYLDINNFDSSDPQKVTKLIARLSSVITNNSQPQEQGGGQIYHYIDKYKELPLWVLIKKMTLGETCHFFDALDGSLKKIIADEVIEEYSKSYKTKISTPSEIYISSFYNMLILLSHFRNVCAHDERLYNIVFKRGGRIPKIILFHKISEPVSNSKLFDCILILGLFLGKKDYRALIKNILSEVESLSKKLPPNLFNAVFIKMGFPKNWKTLLILP